MLAPATISVYAVRELVWCMLQRILYLTVSFTDCICLYVANVNLEELVPLEFPLDALGKLILPDKKKELLVKAIEAVQTQTQHQQVAPVVSKMDPQSNITDRLFLLFHGAPGMGKSLAAQCLANYTRRPLLLVTSGTKADEATSVDCFETAFKLARRWGCLVLLDHVDTVMETRGRESMERNAVVTGRLLQGHRERFGRSANI